MGKAFLGTEMTHEMLGAEPAKYYLDAGGVGLMPDQIWSQRNSGTVPV